MARHVLHRCDLRLLPQLLYLLPGIPTEEEPLDRRDQPITRSTIGCDLHTLLATDPWQDVRLNVLVHRCLPCALPCHPALFQGRHLRAPRLLSLSILGSLATARKASNYFGVLFLQACRAMWRTSRIFSS